MAIQPIAEVKGIKEVLGNLSNAIDMIDGNVLLGIRAAARFVKGEAQSITPVDEGILRNSAFTKSFKGEGSTGPFAVVGYTAEYAAAVHEAPETLRGQPRGDFGKTRDGTSFGGGSGKGFYWDGGENKFLEKAVINNFSRIITIISRFASKSNGSK